LYYYNNHYFQKENYKMSDNKLLAENTIRRFMKLANTDAFSDNFVTENFKEEIKEEEEVQEEAVVAEEEETIAEAEEEEMEMELDADVEEPEMEEPEMEEPEMDAEPEMGAADMSLTEEEAQLLISLGERLAAAIGGAAEEPAEEPELDMEPEMEEEPMEDEEEEPAMRDMYENQEDLVNEVLKRVTKRLVAEKLKNRK
jgi:hypothetical protein